MPSLKNSQADTFLWILIHVEIKPKRCKNSQNVDIKTT